MTRGRHTHDGEVWFWNSRQTSGIIRNHLYAVHEARGIDNIDLGSLEQIHADLHKRKVGVPRKQPNRPAKTCAAGVCGTGEIGCEVALYRKDGAPIASGVLVRVDHDMATGHIDMELRHGPEAWEALNVTVSAHTTVAVGPHQLRQIDPSPCGNPDPAVQCTAEYHYEQVHGRCSLHGQHLTDGTSTVHRDRSGGQWGELQWEERVAQYPVRP